MLFWGKVQGNVGPTSFSQCQLMVTHCKVMLTQCKTVISILYTILEIDNEDFREEKKYLLRKHDKNI